MGSSLLFYELKVVRIYHLHKRFIKDLPELVLFNTSLVPRPIFRMGLCTRLCSLVPGAEEERLVYTDALPVN